MHDQNLHDLIDIYESKIDLIYGEKHDELFKWQALKCWRDEWYKPAESFSSFAERFNAARKEFSLFIDNSRMHPSNGVIKLWEQEPETVERLFNELLTDTKEDIPAVQEHMDSFLDQYEELRQKYYPGNWSYKQDRHSASVFLAMDKPEFNYVYKSSEATAMAKAIDFGFSIGAGRYFSLQNYYRLCDEIVSALKQHESLLGKHFERLTDKHYVDKSLHMLAFDLMYCCRTYGYYSGIIIPEAKKTYRASSPASDRKKNEEEKQARLQALEDEIRKLEKYFEEFEDISLMGVEVTVGNKGTGVITQQIFSRVTARFAEEEKPYILDEKYKGRPRFVDDEKVVSVYTEYNHNKDKLKSLQKELKNLQDRG